MKKSKSWSKWVLIHSAVFFTCVLKPNGPSRMVREHTFSEQVLFVASVCNLPCMARCALWLGASPHEVYDINFRHRETPLFEAAAAGSAAVVHVICNAGANASESVSSGKTPLMAACASGNLATVRALLDHNADVNAVAYAVRCPYTALTIALQRRDTKMVQLLFNHGAKNQRAQVEEV